MRRRLAAGALALAAMQAHAAGPTPGVLPVAPPEAPLSPCRLSGFDRELLCGSLEVPENPDAPQGRRIPIAFAVMPAMARNKEPDPVFVLAGGPGQAARAAGAQVMPLFAALNRRRDIVFVDQRGTGGSNGLACELDPRAPLSETIDPDALADRMRDCWKRLPADTRFYTTPIAMRDLDRVRARLGAERINLWGASYGTRAGLEYLRQFPRRVRTLILDGVAPADMVLPVSFAVDSEAALAKVFAACRAEPACRARFAPALDRFDAWLDALGRSPARVAVTHPTTGVKETLTMRRDGVLSALRAPLYAPLLASALPFVIREAETGNYDPMAALASLLSGTVSENFSYGMHLAVVCAEDVPRIGPADEAAASRTLFGRFFIEQYRRMCAGWPVGVLPPDYYAPSRGDAPVLLLSGGQDPATPPRHAERVARSLPRAKHLVAPNAGHGVSTMGCAPELIERFVKSASLEGLDGACLERMPRPPFFRPFDSAPSAGAGAPS